MAPRAAPTRAKKPAGRRDFQFTAALTPEDGGYVAQCLEVDVASQGDSVEQALANLKEALELYFEDHAPPDTVTTPLIAPVSVTL